MEPATAKKRKSSRAEPAAKRPRAAKPIPTRRVLSIDVGLRNLGLAVVTVLSEEDAAAARARPLVGTLASCVKETAGQGGEGMAAEDPVVAMLLRRIRVDHAENVDVLEENGCTAKNAKAIGPLRQVAFWHECMVRRWGLLLDPPPDVVVVEVQDGGNATMRQMSTGIVGLFMGHFQARHRDGKIARVPEFTMVRGDMKLKICHRVDAAWGSSGQRAGKAAGAEEAQGHEEPAAEPEPEPAAEQGEEVKAAEQGEEVKAAEQGEEVKAAGRKQQCRPPPAYLMKANPRRYHALKRAFEEQQQEQAASTFARGLTGRSRAAYDQRKRFAVHAFELYMQRVLRAAPWLVAPELGAEWGRATHKKRRDISDAVLQGIYVICRDAKLL
jgi:hypothetical protein